MKCRYVHSKEVVKTNRFDGSYHNAESNIYDSVISAHSLHPLSFYCSNIFTSGRNRRVYTKPEYGYPFLSNSDASSQDPFGTCNYSSRKYGYDEDALLKGGMILTGRVGAIGQTSFVPKYWEKLNTMGSDNIIRIVVKPEYKNGFIYAFLASKMGNLLFWKQATGGGQPFINDTMVGSLPIPQMPEAFQQEVDDLIQESARLREEATDALNEAKKTLSDYIGINFALTQGCKIGLIQNKSLTSSIQTSFCSHSFLNNSVAAFERIKDKCQLLGSCKVDVWYPGMFKRAYVNNGLPYMQGSSIFETNPFRRCAHLSKARTPKLDELWLKENYILITCAGSLGQVKIITKEYEDKMAIGSPDIIRVFSKDSLFTNEFLFAYLQLPLVQDYMQSFKYGSVIERFDALRVKSIPIIIPTKEISDSVTDLIRYYKDCTYKSFCKEEKAISMVEQEIEKWNK